MVILLYCLGGCIGINYIIHFFFMSYFQHFLGFWRLENEATNKIFWSAIKKISLKKQSKSEIEMKSSLSSYLKKSLLQTLNF